MDTGVENSSPLVSVVIPAHNRPDYLQRAIESVLTQEYPNIELVVVDDCSPTLLEPVVESIDLSTLTRFEFIRHDLNSGGSAARNTGIEASTGPLIAFLDDDDQWDPRKLSKQVELFRDEDPTVGVVYAGVRQIDSEGKTKAVKTPSICGDVTERLLQGNFIGTFSAVMVRRAAINDVGLLDERFPSWQDWEYYLRLSYVCEFAAVPDPLVIRESGDQKQVSDDLETKRNVTKPLFLETFCPLAEEFGIKTEFRATVAFCMAESAIANAEYAYARQMVFYALWLIPTDLQYIIYSSVLLGGRFTTEPIIHIKRYVSRLRKKL